MSVPSENGAHPPPYVPEALRTLKGLPGSLTAMSLSDVSFLVHMLQDSQLQSAITPMMALEISAALGTESLNYVNVFCQTLAQTLCLVYEFPSNCMYENEHPNIAK